MSDAAEPAASREDLLALIVVLREQNVALAERCALLEAQNETLVVANERLTARVAELERRLNRNSNNSNFPSSHDVFRISPGSQSEDQPQPGHTTATSSGVRATIRSTPRPPTLLRPAPQPTAAAGPPT